MSIQTVTKTIVRAVERAMDRGGVFLLLVLGLATAGATAAAGF